MDPLFEAKLPDDREELVSPVAASVQQPPPPQPQRAMRRENDSMDDFEHLEHDGSQLDEAPSGALDVTSVQLIDLPRAAPSGVSDLMDVASKLERNILDTSIPVDERILQPVPATPPPSASFEKFDEPPGGAGREAHALHHRFDGQQDEAGRSRYSDQRFDESPREDAKAATMAFMETERAIGDYHGGSVDRRPEDELGAGVATQRAVDGPAGDPVSMEDYRTREHELGVNSTVVENEPESSSGKARLAPDKSAADVDELLAGADDHRPSSDDIAYESSGVESACRLPSAGEAAKMQTLGFAHGESKRSSDYDFLGDDGGAPGAAIGKSESSRNVVDDDTWNVVEKPELQKRSSTAMFVGREADETAKVERELFEAPTKPLPPLPKAELDDEDEDRHFAARNERVNDEKFVMSDDFMTATETSGPRGQKSRGQQQQQQQSGAETGDSEFESAPEQSPAKSSTRTAGNGGGHHVRKINADDIAPKEIFAQMGLDAWFNPERLNPKVAALIYWRQPEKTGIVFGAVLGVLLSLAYFSLISVFAYLSLLTLTGTVGFRVYKTFMQAVQKTSDGHPFKDILEVELTLPSEKVHEVADVAVAHANAAVAELRRLFLVEDFIDSLKFGVVLWCFTYLGSWFNGMTLIIIGVVALFTLPKVYETNKAQIDQNVALVHGKINELTAKVKAAIPLGKKAEPTKEE